MFSGKSYAGLGFSQLPTSYQESPYLLPIEDVEKIGFIGGVKTWWKSDKFCHIVYILEQPIKKKENISFQK